MEPGQIVRAIKLAAVIFVGLGCHDLVTALLSFINAHKLVLSQNALGLFVGYGLWRIDREWRICGLILLWINIVGILLSYALAVVFLPFIFSKMGMFSQFGIKPQTIALGILKTPTVATAILAASIVLLVLLSLPNVKTLFRNAPVRGGKTVPLFLGAIFLLWVLSWTVKAQPPTKTEPATGSIDRVSVAQDKFDYRFSLGPNSIEPKTRVTEPIQIEPGSMGYIKDMHENVTLPIRDAVGIWSEKIRRLTVYLFPQILTDKEKAALREFGNPSDMYSSLLTMNEQIARKRYGQVTFDFTSEAGQTDIRNAGFSFSYLVEIDGRPSGRGASIALLAQDVKNAFESITIDQNVRFKLQYQRELVKKIYVFVLDVEAPIWAEPSKADGVHKTFYEPGKVFAESSFRNGLLDGPSKYFYDTGELLGVSEFSNGKANGKHVSYYKSGKVKSETIWVNGQATGVGEERYETGELMAQFHYSGFTISKMEYLDKKGNPISREQADKIQKLDEGKKIELEKPEKPESKSKKKKRIRKKQTRPKS